MSDDERARVRRHLAAANLLASDARAAGFAAEADGIDAACDQYVQSWQAVEDSEADLTVLIVATDGITYRSKDRERRLAETAVAQARLACLAAFHELERSGYVALRRLDHEEPSESAGASVTIALDANDAGYPTRAQIEEEIARLQATGARYAGYGTLASRFNVRPSTIRRRLGKLAK